MIRISLLFLTLALLLSCAQDEEKPMENPTQIDKYFLLKDFVKGQIYLLDEVKVRKMTSIKGKVENTEQQMNIEDWRKELDIFIQADINKASLSTSYATEKGAGFTIHRLKPGEKSSIQEIKVAYDEDEISQISFTSHQQNIFYTSESEGILSVDTATGKISSYQVRGIQKVWFLPTNKIEVKGEVIA